MHHQSTEGLVGPQKLCKQRGMILPFFSILLICLVLIAAFAIDLGNVMRTTTLAKTAADAGALKAAHARSVGEDEVSAKLAAEEVVKFNLQNGRILALTPSVSFEEGNNTVEVTLDGLWMNYTFGRFAGLAGRNVSAKSRARWLDSAPVSMFFALDRSLSMILPAEGESSPKFEVLKNAMEEVLDAQKGTANEIQFVTYNHEEGVVSEKLDGLDEGDAWLKLSSANDWLNENLEPGGCTAIGEAMRKAYANIGTFENSRKVVVLLTDGIANYARVEDDDCFDPKGEAVYWGDKLREEDVRIYTIALGKEVGPNGTRQYDKDLLERMAGAAEGDFRAENCKGVKPGFGPNPENAGRFFAAPDRDALLSALNEIMRGNEQWRLIPASDDIQRLGETVAAEIDRQ